MAELYLSVANMREMALQGTLFVIETFVLVLAIPAFLVLPGAVFLALAIVIGGLIWALTKSMEGPTVVFSRIYEESIGSARRHEDERWVFLNGCAVG